MSSMTKADFLTAVASRLDKESSDFTAAQIVEFKAWAVNCLQWVLPLAPEYAIESILDTATPGVTVALPTNCLKVVRVATADGDICRQVVPDEFQSKSSAYASGSQSYGEGFRIWADVMGTVKAFRNSGNLTVHYILEPSWGSPVHVINNDGASDRYFYLQRPHQAAADGGLDEPGVGDNWEIFWDETAVVSATPWAGSTDYSAVAGDYITIPNGWNGLIASYAAAQAKLQDEEMEEAQSLWKQFNLELTRFGEFLNIPQTVGG